MGKENQRVMISKRLLKEALLKLLNDKHIEEITVSELCKQAEINRATFYRHYHTPHDILLEMEYDFIQRFYESPIIERNKTDLRKRVFYMCEFIYENKEMVKLFFENYTNADFTLLFQRYFSDYIENRAFLCKDRAMDKNQLQLMTTFWVYGIHGLINQWILKEIPETPEEIAEILLGFWEGNISISL